MQEVLEQCERRIKHLVRMLVIILRMLWEWLLIALFLIRKVVVWILAIFMTFVVLSVIKIILEKGAGIPPQPYSHDVFGIQRDFERWIDNLPETIREAYQKYKVLSKLKREAKQEGKTLIEYTQIKTPTDIICECEKHRGSLVKLKEALKRYQEEGRINSACAHILYEEYKKPEWGGAE